MDHEKNTVGFPIHDHFSMKTYQEVLDHLLHCGKYDSYVIPHLHCLSSRGLGNLISRTAVLSGSICAPPRVGKERRSWRAKSCVQECRKRPIDMKTNTGAVPQDLYVYADTIWRISRARKPLPGGGPSQSLEENNGATR
jgi:hypothetical protein